MKNKSIFQKQLILYVGTLFVSFLLLGGILSVVYTRHYMREMESKLIVQGKKISEEYTKAYFTGDLKDLRYELQILEDYMDASVFFINRDGVLVMASPRIKDKWIGQALTNMDVLGGVLEGKIVSVEGKINGMFDEPVLTVGYPFQVGQMAGIFMCTSMPEIERSIQGMYRVGLFSLIIVMLVGIILVYISSKKISRPLMQMNDAVKVIARGDFEQRVEIKSQDELGQLGESFNRMAESLYKHEKVSRDFIANVSHDLRSPLTSIQGFLNAVIDGTVPAEEQNHYLKIVLEESQRLAKLTNDIVDLSKALTSTITLEITEFDINDLIRDSLERLEPRLKEKKIRINGIFANKTTLVLADRDKIARVLHNLLDNAIKFSEKDAMIEIETTIKDDKKVLVHVRDYGMGISEEEQKYIFDRFYKADFSRGRDKHGSGLGLSIVRELLLAHGENIDVKSEEGKGAEFIFSLKLQKEG